ncbi:putative glycosyltransferase [Bacillus sp. TS-2]|nr:putative glycosyltransferase [Bacillus sp. TS-2]
MRIDGHTIVESNFLSSYLKVIEKNSEASCVGGVIISRGLGFIGQVNEYIYSHSFGVGNSKFRTLKKDWEGYVDTVPYGAYNREVFNQIGYFNENLKRNEDLEFHKRLKDVGGSFYLSTSIRSVYFVRNSIKGLIDKSLGDGTWNIIADRITPGSLRIRHKIPLVAFSMCLFLLFLTPFSKTAFWILTFFILLYLILNIVFSLGIIHVKGLKYYFPTIFNFFLLHFFRGFGSFKAIFKKEFWKSYK